MESKHHRLWARCSLAPSGGMALLRRLSALKGSDLGQTIAHEGQHIEDDMTFLNSFNAATGN